MLHGSPALVAAFGDFQLDATTMTPDGRRRFIAAIQTARRELGRSPLDTAAAATLFFGADPDPRNRIVADTPKSRSVN